MNKNKYLLPLIALILLAANPLPAQTEAVNSTDANKATATPAAKGSKKKIKIDYENDLVMGNYDVPDAQFLNSRRMIKYKELFNKRTNFIDEIDSNKGLFNEYQK